jgi:CheY-like chemotaxis protein
MPKSILIIEDSEIVSMHLQKVLQRAHYKILAITSSGEEAIKLVKNQTPDLIIMDVMLEGKYDGIETSIEINKVKDIPVIYLTALNDRKTIDRAKLTFPNTFLSKPFAESELLSNVELSIAGFKSQMQHYFQIKFPPFFEWAICSPVFFWVCYSIYVPQS